MVYTFSKDVAIYLYIIFDLSLLFKLYFGRHISLCFIMLTLYIKTENTVIGVTVPSKSLYVIKENIAILVLFIFYALLIDSIDSTFQCKLFFNLYTNVSLQSVWAHFVIFAGADLSVPFNQSHFCVGKR